MLRVDRAGLGIAIALGALYLVLIPLQPYPLSWLLKPIPVLIFALLSWRAFPGTTGRVLACGYLAAAVGDFFLDFGDRDGMFRQALIAFLVNQIAFIIAFAMLGRGKPMRWLRALPVIAYSVLLAVWLVPQAGSLKLAVSIYLAALLAMAILACRVETRVGPLWFGAIFFVLADSLIGVNKFAAPFPNAVLIIVTLYLTGQSLIAWGLLREARSRGYGGALSHISNGQCDNRASI